MVKKHCQKTLKKNKDVYGTLVFNKMKNLGNLYLQYF